MVFFCEAGTYSGGSGTQGDPYEIAKAADLIELGGTTGDYSCYFELTANIDMSGHSFSAAVIAPDTVEGDGFDGTVFSGNFNGKGKTISNLTITASGYYGGLFGLTNSSAKISNLGILSSTVSSGNMTGILVGANNCQILNCYVDGNCMVSGTEMIGGLVGRNAGDLLMCYSNADVSGNSSIGGLAGYSEASMINCHTDATVNATGDMVGGLVGNNNGNLSNCYSQGTTNGNWAGGGLIGYNSSGFIYNCYSTGTTGGFNSIGGLIGHVSGGSIVSDCYSSGGGA